MTKYTTIIDDVFVSCTIDVDDNDKLTVEVEDYHPEGVYTEEELKNLVTKELENIKEENRLNFLLNELEE